MSSPPSGRPSFVQRVLTWTVRPLGFVAGLVTSMWQTRLGRRPRAGGEATKPVRLSRREEKRRRKELWRSTKAAGRRRAA